MPTVSQTIKFRQRRYTRENRSPWLKLGLISGILISLAIVILTLAGINYYLGLTRDLPSLALIPSLLEPPNGVFLQPTRLYDRTHQHLILSLENSAATGKQYIQLTVEDGEISNQSLYYLANATIASYDPAFWKEPGYSLSGISEGTHPTLAQLLIANLVLDSEKPSLERNLRERLLAAQLTAQYGREKIIEWFVNSAQFGKFIYGADAAARVYFGKPAERLSLAEAAMLVAIEQSPSIDPWNDLSQIKDLQAQIIVKMLEQGFIGYDEAQQALKEYLQFQPQTALQSLSPTFTNLVLFQLSQSLPLEHVYRGGYEIVTSLDYELQHQASCASQVQLARLQGAQQQGFMEEPSECDAASYLPNLSMGGTSPAQDLLTNIVVLDPGSGQILAMVGDESSDILPSIPNQHAVGTIVSPFLYLTAFSRGMSPATLLWDIPVKDATNDSSVVFSEASQHALAAYHGPVSLRSAFVNDYIGAAAEVYQQVGSENVWLTEKQLGIRTDHTLSISQAAIDDLYSQQSSLLEIVRAYGVLANQGMMAGQPDQESAQEVSPAGLNPITILNVTDSNGRTWLDWTEPETLPVVSTQLAYLTSNLLSDEDDHQTSSGQQNQLKIGRPVAVISGITMDHTSAWTVGYTPQLVVGVWIGHSQPVFNSNAPELADDLWHAIMESLTQQLPVQDFAVPSGIIRTLVCDPSGMLVSPLCPAVAEEVFLEGNEPTQVDNLYQKYWVNRETGLLATIFTPANLVEEKIYLTPPTEAMAWAKKSGYPIPPDTYDDKYLPLPSTQDVRFNTPGMFDHVTGLVRFYGSARGENFAYYRLQVGEGLNPQQWIQIGEDVDRPVQDGLLGTWDTTSLHGTYIVELLVVKQDKQVEQAFLQVTIDNEMPLVQILAPQANEIFIYKQGASIIIQVSANDNTSLKQVEFYVDHHLISTLYEAPFVVLWPVVQGEHNLQVIAYDFAGNQNDAAVSFSVTK
jgi:membrane carboxypeptidase/penicillin-binding protein